MESHIEAMLKALVAVAWTDGEFADGENEALDAIISAYEVDEENAGAIREYAKTPRALDDVELTELSLSDRETLFQHAVLMTYADGNQSAVESAMLNALATRLHISDNERGELIHVAENRIERLKHLL